MPDMYTTPLVLAVGTQIFETGVLSYFTINARTRNAQQTCDKMAETVNTAVYVSLMYAMNHYFIIVTD